MRRLPWKVDYRYSNGPKGRIACRDEDAAVSAALQIKRNMYPQAGDCTVTITNVDNPDEHPRVYVFDAKEALACEECYRFDCICDERSAT